MNQTEIRILRLLKASRDHSTKVMSLANELKISHRSIERTLKNLEEKGLVKIGNGMASWSSTPKSSVFARLSNDMPIYKLMIDSGERILPALLEAKKMSEISNLTGLSSSTIQRSLNRMKETGAIIQRGNEFYINEKYPDVRLLARILREEELSRLTRNKNEEIVYRNSSSLIKRVPLGIPMQEGARTAFSAFASFGMDLRPEFDYYIVPEQTIQKEDALVHALLVSKNKLERTHCAVFYVINRNTIDIALVRNKCESFNVSKLWIDLEAYIRDELTEDRDLFLPWKEFADRCRMYGVNPDENVPRKSPSDFFLDIGRILQKEVSVYLIGGENMRIKGMKQATKDIDFVTGADKTDPFEMLVSSLTKLGYHRLGVNEISDSDAKMNPSAILEHPKYPRLDLFSKVICNKFVLLDSMIRDSKETKVENLKVLLASDEDVFLLKSITDREADDVDMIQILRRSEKFDWKKVLLRLYEQESVTKQHYCFSVFDTITFIQDSTKMKIPIFQELLNHTTDVAILKILKKFGKQSVKELVKRVDNVEEYEIRNRLQRLSQKKLVKKEKLAGKLFFKIFDRATKIPN